jgi:DNA repair protein RecO (recombination protein O)
MDEPAQGIVLKSHPYSESSLIIRWLTHEQGRVDTLARGARRPKSPFRGKLDLFYLADFTFARSRHSTLHSLRDLRLLDTHAPLRSDLHRLRQASYGSALLTQTTEPGVPLPELFDLFSSFLQYLAHHQPGPLLPLAFELKLLAALGQQPNPAELRLTPPTRHLAESCLALDWHQIIIPPHCQIAELDGALSQFLQFHLGRVLDQRAAALSL